MSTRSHPLNWILPILLLSETLTPASFPTLGQYSIPVHAHIQSNVASTSHSSLKHGVGAMISMSQNWMGIFFSIYFLDFSITAFLKH